MIQAKEIMSSVRFQLGDMQGAKVSDFELVESINRALTLIYSTFSAKRVTVGLKTTALFIDEDERSTFLPSDFQRVSKVLRDNRPEFKYSTRRPECVNEYRVIGNHFEAFPGEYILEYFYIPNRISNETDLIDIPRYVETALISASSALVSHDEGTAATVAIGLCILLTAQEISNYENRGPVDVWGGKG